MTARERGPDVKWKKERPTKPGFYWARDIHTSPHIVMLWPERGSSRLEVLLTGTDDSWYLHEHRYDDAEWYGPLEAPP